MNMLKRFVAMFLVLCMVTGMVPFNTFATETSEEPTVTTEVTEVDEALVNNEETTEAAEESVNAGDSTEAADESAASEEVTHATEAPVTTEEATDAAEETTEAATEATEESTEATEAATEEATEATEETTEVIEDIFAELAADLINEVAAASITLGTKPADGTVTGQPFNTAVSENYRIPGLVNHNGTLIASADARWDYEKDGGGLDLVVSRSSDGSTWNYTFAGYLGDNGNVWNADSSTLMDPVIISDGSTLYLLADMYPAGYSISSSSTTNTFSDTAIGFDASGNLLLSKDSRNSYGYYLKDGKIYATDGTEQEGYTVQGWYDLYQNGNYVTNLFFSDSPFQVRATSYICLTTSTDGGKTWNSPILVNAKPSGVAWMVLGPGSGLALDNGNIAFTAYDNSNIYLIWGSDANGWNRISTSAATNESSIIELNDGTIRAFVKRASSNTIAYVDFTKTSSGYTAGSLVDTGVTNFSQCMVSSLHYSKTLNDQEVVLVCCPSKPGSGDWNGRFNGKIHMFTLDDSNNMTLVNSYALNGESEFFAYSNMTEMNDGTVAVLYEDDCISYSAGNYYGNASHITYTNVNLETAFGVAFDENQDIFVWDDNNTSGEIQVAESAGVQHIHVEPTTVADMTVNYVAYDIHLCTNGDDTCVDCTDCDKAYTGKAFVTLPLTDALKNSSMVKGFVVETDGSITSIYDVENDGEYVSFEVPHFSVVGLADADDEVVYDAEVNVELHVGETSQIYKDATGDYSATATINNKSIATMNATGVSGVTETTVSTTKATALEGGATYIIRVYGSNYALSTDSGRGDWGTNTLAFQENTLTANEKHMWTLEEVTGGYKLKSANGYLNLGTGNNAAYLNDTGEVFTITSSNTGWIIGNQSGRYVNALGGLTTYYSAGGWTGDGTRFDLYKVMTASGASTEITFTGVAEGTTYAVAGNTKYNIKVTYRTADVHVYTTVSKTTAVTGTVTADDIAAFNAANGSVVTVALSDDGNTLTFTGVGEGTVTNALLGNTKYTISVTTGATAGDISDFNDIVGEETYEDENTNATYKSVLDMEGKVIKKLTISAGASFNLDVDATDYESVVWSAVDTSVATVDEEGVVTAVAVGKTTVIATVVKNGKIESIEIPVEVKPSQVEGVSAVVPIFFYIEQVDHTTPYYTMFLSTGDDDVLEAHYTMVPVTEGEVIWIERPTDSALGWIWTATPDADHALAYMASTGSVSQYYPLKDSTGALGESTGEITNDNPGDYYKNSISYQNVINVGSDDGEENWQTVLDTHLATAISETYKCDGAMSNTRWDHDGVPSMVSSMTFISDPLPKIEKTVDGVLPTTRKTIDYRRYTEGMVASVGELVYFKISVTIDRPTAWVKDSDGNDTAIGAINYTNAIVEDTVLQGAYLYTKELDQADGTYDGEIAEAKRTQTTDITTQLNAEWGADEQTRTIDLYLVYQIQEGDIPKFVIDNVANLNTNYQSAYSSGISAREAVAKASITVVGRAMDNIVIDFGQKVTITGLTDTYLKGVYTGENVKYSAKYGTVEITKNADDTYDVIYTPTSILQSADAIWLYGLGVDEDNNQVEKVINGFIVYPATTVYYEEGFIFGDKTTGNWVLDQSKKATMVQECEPLGKSNYDSSGKLTGKTSGKKHPYGYDPIYAGSGTEYMSGSAKSYASTSTMGSSTEFTFTGTGFELYANCDTDSGYVSVLNRGGSVVKLYAINTHTGHAEDPTDATAGQSGKFYSLPIVSVKDLTHGEYTVRVMKTYDSNEIQIDGVRIINTIADSSVFEVDKEDNPEFYQLRDYVLSAMNVGTSEQYGTVAEMIDQVYAGISTDTEAPTAAILADGDYDADVQDLLDNGPKNEVYLYKDQTLVFNVQTSRSIQIGLKAPQTATSYSVAYSYTNNGTATTTKVAESKSLNTSVDMFYALGNEIGTERTYTITITNHGDKVLSITDLKICDDPNAALVELTPEDIEVTLRELGYIDDGEPDSGENVPDAPTEPEIPVEPEITYADAILNISLVDYTGAEISKTVLQVTGVEGENNAFGAEQLLAAAKMKLPSNYAVADETSITDVDVVYGESKSISIQIGKVATLKVTYISLFGRVLGSATIRKVQTSDGYCRFTAYDWKEYAPAGHYMLWSLSKYVPFGGYASTTVPVI